MDGGSECVTGTSVVVVVGRCPGVVLGCVMEGELRVDKKKVDENRRVANCMSRFLMDPVCTGVWR